jgi:hypothetical protein
MAEEQRLTANIVPPFAMTEQELRGIGAFAHENGLDEIGKLVAELRTLRRAYMEQSRLIGILKGNMPEASKRFAAEIEDMTNATPKS